MLKEADLMRNLSHQRIVRMIGMDRYCFYCQTQKDKFIILIFGFIHTLSIMCKLFKV
jgi:hypothetical protein